MHIVSGTQLGLKRLNAGSNVTIGESNGDITIAAAAEVAKQEKEAAVEAAVALTIQKRDAENNELMQRAIQIAVEEAVAKEREESTVAAAKARRNSSLSPIWNIATMVDVTEVPMLAPMTREMACLTVSSSAATIVMMMDVDVDED